MEHLRQDRIRIKALHLDRPVEQFPRPIYFRAGYCTGDATDSQIDLWRKASVESELFTTRFLTIGQIKEVQKTQIKRFLDFVGPITSQYDGGDMRIDTAALTSPCFPGMMVEHRPNKLLMLLNYIYAHTYLS